MAEETNTTAKRVNEKAPKFEKYLKDQNLNFFQKQDLKDEAQTVIFRSNISVEKQLLPVLVITDNTIYTIVRVQIGEGLVKNTNKIAFLDYLNGLNRSYKTFKYLVTEDGSVILDCCLPSTNESFDPSVVRIIIDVIVDHLQHEYKNIMKEAWA